MVFVAMTLRVRPRWRGVKDAGDAHLRHSLRSILLALARMQSSKGEAWSNDLVHGYRRAVVDLFEGCSITCPCRPVELSVGGEAGQVVGLVPGWRPVRRPGLVQSRQTSD